MKKLKDLKIGETVVIWSDDRRHEPVENIVHKVGRTKLHTKHPIYPQVRQFNIETACGEYGYKVFPVIWKNIWFLLRKKNSQNNLDMNFLLCIHYI